MFTKEFMESDFEKKLAQQPMRELPAEWRKEILSTASRPLPAEDRSFFTMIQEAVRSLVWPNPRAWSALAAVWLAILAVNVASGDKRPGGSNHSPAPDFMAALQEQQRILTQLTNQTDRVEVQAQRPALPTPRSERRREEEFALV